MPTDFVSVWSMMLFKNLQDIWHTNDEVGTNLSVCESKNSRILHLYYETEQNETPNTHKALSAPADQPIFIPVLPKSF